MLSPPELLLLATLVLGVAGLGAALVWLARTTRDHRRHLDERLDALARQTHGQALAADQRADTLGERVERVERAQRVDHLLDLIRAGVREGRIDADAARRLEASTLALRVDAFDRETPP